jgi:hypothetical protein
MIASKQDWDVEEQLLPGSCAGLGTWLGAVKVTVRLLELAGMLPVDEVQGCRLPVLELPEEFTLVVWYWQDQLLMLTLVLPVTVPVSVTDCETMTVSTEGLTMTFTTFVLLLLHPPRASKTSAPKLSGNVA